MYQFSLASLSKVKYVSFITMFIYFFLAFWFADLAIQFLPAVRRFRKYSPVIKYPKYIDLDFEPTDFIREIILNCDLNSQKC